MFSVGKDSFDVVIFLDVVVGMIRSYARVPHS
jgi:hypothetical protein